MNDRERDIPTEAEARLAAVADGTLPPERLDDALREIAASPQLTRGLERQRSAVAALRALDVPAPDALRERIATAAAPERTRPRVRWRLPALRPLVLAGGGLAAAAAVTLALVLSSGGTAAPTVAQAAPIAWRAATAGAPAVRPGGRELAAATGGITYPTWSWIGWHATGQRTDALGGGRTARTVFYADGSGMRIGYTIVDGRTLPVSGGRLVAARGSHVRLLEVGGSYVVTWERDGHTCIVSGRGVAPARLAALASYET
jgi:hypothetical protein